MAGEGEPEDLATEQQEDLGSQFAESPGPRTGFFSGLGSFGVDAGDSPAGRALEYVQQGLPSSVASGLDQGLLYGAAAFADRVSRSTRYELDYSSRIPRIQTDERPDATKESAFATAARGMAAKMAPDPYVAGTAYRVLQGMSEFGTKAAIGGIAAGPVGAYMTEAGISYYESYHEYLDQTGDPALSEKLAQVDAGVSGIFTLAGGVGDAFKTSSAASKILAEAAAGVATNVPLGVANRYLDHRLLEDAGFHDLAEQQRPWDGLSLLTDIGMGLLPAGAEALHEGAWAGMTKVAKIALGDSGLARDAADVANQRKGMSALAPGVPVDARAATFHEIATQVSNAQHLAGEQTDLSKAPLPASATFVQRPAENHSDAVAAFAQHLEAAGFTGELAGLDADTRALIERSTGEKLPESEPPAAAPTVASDLDRAIDGGESPHVAAAAEAPQIPPRLRDIPQGENLTAADRAIETRFREQIQSDPEGAIRAYANLADSHGGKFLNTDTARELSGDYVADRTRSAAVHEPASAIIKEIYARKLAEAPREGERPEVLFSAGGTGVGKSVALQRAGVNTQRAQIVYDSNLGTLKSSVSKIEQALGAGKSVRIVYTYRDPVEALKNGALPRAMTKGRTAPIGEHLKTHVGSNAVIRELARRYKDDPRVKIIAYDNSRGKGKSAPIDIGDLPELKAYHDLAGKLHETLESERAAGRISESVYRGFKGSSEEIARRGTGGDGSGHASAGDRAAGQPEPGGAEGRDASTKQLPVRGAGERADLSEPFSLTGSAAGDDPNQSNLTRQILAEDPGMRITDADGDPIAATSLAQRAAAIDAQARAEAAKGFTSAMDCFKQNGP